MSQDATEGSADTSAPTLQISDIEAVVRVIDYAAEQGAFKGWGVIDEVRLLRDRLYAFVSSIATAQDQTQAAAGDDIPDSPAAE